MNVYLWVFLCVMVIPLAEGALLALLLRDLHARHPLPLGGVIATRRATPPVPAATKPVDTENAPADRPVVPTEPVAVEPRPTETEALPTPSEASPETPPEVSVFDGTEKIPQNVPVHEILEQMTTAAPQEIPNDFEDRIDSSARSEDELHSGIQHTIMDDLDENDLAALAGALPRDNIDFTQELESDNAEEISSTAKEVLGSDFDVDALKTQSAEFATALAEKNESTEIPLDVQENETGTIQVSSLFATDVSPQLAQFITPQTIFPTFSDDWIQKAGDTAETIAGDPEHFCFTEELRPMFSRKKKSS